MQVDGTGGKEGSASVTNLGNVVQLMGRGGLNFLQHFFPIPLVQIELCLSGHHRFAGVVGGHVVQGAAHCFVTDLRQKAGVRSGKGFVFLGFLKGVWGRKEGLAAILDIPGRDMFQESTVFSNILYERLAGM